MIDEQLQLKEEKIEVRMSAAQKAKLVAYAKRHKATVATVVRIMINEKISREEKDNGKIKNN